MHKLMLCIFILISQNEACLDVLVRSFNEIFSPIIETGDNRIEEPHNVDELTYLYKRDANGNLVLRKDNWPSSNTYASVGNSKNSKSRENKNLVGSLFNHLQLSHKATSDEDIVACHKEDKEEHDSNQDRQHALIRNTPSLALDSATDVEPESQYSDDVEYEDQYEKYLPEYDEYNYHPKRGYVPGRRPFLDLLIKLLETFQLTATSEFIEFRPRYATSQYQPKTEET